MILGWNARPYPKIPIHVGQDANLIQILSTVNLPGSVIAIMGPTLSALLLDLMVNRGHQALPSYTLITPYYYFSILVRELYLQIQHGSMVAP